MIATALLVLVTAAEFQGYISDEACGWNNARPGKEAQECAKRCVDAGWPSVFVRDGGMAVFKIEAKAQQQLVRPFVGDHVTVTGEITGEKLVVKTIKKSPAPPPKPKA